MRQLRFLHTRYQVRRWVWIKAHAPALIFALLWILGSNNSARAQTEIVLHRFSGLPDGNTPLGTPTRDSNGNLYGTTFSGGTGTACGNGCGTVFEVTASGTETVLYSFTGGADGAGPVAGLIRDSKGNLYGTAAGGGSYNWGTVFELSRVGKGSYELTVLYSFKGGTDGATAEGLVRDVKGNIYGTTAYGGGIGCGGFGCGTVFKLTPAGTESLLHVFGGSPDGQIPFAGPILDAKGNLYGTTTGGGIGDCGGTGCGTVFEVTASGVEKILYSFANGSDGAFPSGTLLRDKKGNLYGIAQGGGVSDWGTVFEITNKQELKVLYSFTGGADGCEGMSDAGLVRDAKGTLFGTAWACAAYGFGGVFEISPSGAETVRYSFQGGADGAFPYSGLVLDKKGNLYGVTEGGGGQPGYGTVFKIIP